VIDDLSGRHPADGAVVWPAIDLTADLLAGRRLMTRTGLWPGGVAASIIAVTVPVMDTSDMLVPIVDRRIQ
jgi:hypothetical protein